jgi:hypothetical protein
LEGVVYMFKAGKAWLKGQRPDLDDSVHAKITDL